ncbi:MAG TPA: hypothetical protein VKR06_01975 [Ktedonosporobacter sp.]|nr:hypothetical protein [Ktedonosporobacter sp.]
MKETVELIDQMTDETNVSSEAFSFEIEELDGNRAIMLVFLDPCPTCHHGLQPAGS